VHPDVLYAESSTGALGETASEPWTMRVSNNSEGGGAVCEEACRDPCVRTAQTSVSLDHNLKEKWKTHALRPTLALWVISDMTFVNLKAMEIIDQRERLM
jgi:hypothetical protein